jgi:hypothetical protein
MRLQLVGAVLPRLHRAGPTAGLRRCDARQTSTHLARPRLSFRPPAAGAFFGYRRGTLGRLPVTVADETKAIVDSLFLTQYAGDVSEVAKALRNALQDGWVSATGLIECARRLENGQPGSAPGLPARILEPAHTDGLTPSTGPVRLDPCRPRRGEYAHRWRLYLNIPRIPRPLPHAGSGLPGRETRRLCRPYRSDCLPPRRARPQHNAGVLRREPDLTCAVLMPWIEDSTWTEVILENHPLTPHQAPDLTRLCRPPLPHGAERHCPLRPLRPQRPPAHAGAADGRPPTADHLPSTVELVDAEGLYAQACRAGGPAERLIRLTPTAPPARVCGGDCRLLRWGRVAGQNAQLGRRDRARGLLQQARPASARLRCRRRVAPTRRATAH